MERQSNALDSGNPNTTSSVSVLPTNPSLIPAPPPFQTLTSVYVPPVTLLKGNIIQSAPLVCPSNSNTVTVPPVPRALDPVPHTNAPYTPFTSSSFFYAKGTNATVNPSTNNTSILSHTSSIEKTKASDTIKWVEYKDENSKQSYYFNTETKQCVWDMPEEYRMYRAKAQVEKLKQNNSINKLKHEKEQQTQLVEIRQTFDQLTPLERRQTFQTFLKEKNVSPEFKWQEALRYLQKEKHDRDPRWLYLLNSVGEKKQLFAEYCTQSKSQQVIEKRRQIKRDREEFTDLINSKKEEIIAQCVDDSGHLHLFNWTEFIQSPLFESISIDPRWNRISEEHKKQELFEACLTELTRAFEQNQILNRQKIKEECMSMLSDSDFKLFFGNKRIHSNDKRQIWETLQEKLNLKKNDRKVCFDAIDSYSENLRKEQLQTLDKESERSRSREFKVWIEKLLEMSEIARHFSWDEVEAVLNMHSDEMSRFDSLKLKRKQRIFQKLIREERHRFALELRMVRTYLKDSDFGKKWDNGKLTYSQFAEILVTRVLVHDHARHRIEDADRRLELEQYIIHRLDKDGSMAKELALPSSMRAVFELLMLSEKKRNRKRRSERTNATERPKRMSRSQSRSRDDPSATFRSMSRSVGRYSTSRSHGRYSRSRSVSRSHSSEPRRRGSGRKRIRRTKSDINEEMDDVEKQIQKARERYLSQQDVKVIKDDENELEEGEVA